MSSKIRQTGKTECYFIPLLCVTLLRITGQILKLIILSFVLFWIIQVPLLLSMFHYKQSDLLGDVVDRMNYK